MSVRALSSATEPELLVVVLRGRIEPEHVQSVREFVCERLERSDPKRVVCDLREVVSSDAVAVDALARLQLGARRKGCVIELRNASTELKELLELAGLAEALGLPSD